MSKEDFKREVELLAPVIADAWEKLWTSAPLSLDLSDSKLDICDTLYELEKTLAEYAGVPSKIK